MPGLPVTEEELTAGAPDDGRPDDPGGRRAWLWVVIGAAVLGAGAVVTGPAGISSPSPPVTPPAASPEPSPAVYRTTRPGPLSYLDVGSVCPPRTDGRRSLTVSFELANVGGVRVEVLEVTPTLPLAGLTVKAPVRSGGSCATPGHSSARQPIGVGESRLYTLSLRLPTTCPKPYPVQVTYLIDVNGQQMTTTLPLLNDLGATAFDSCPSWPSRPIRAARSARPATPR